MRAASAPEKTPLSGDLDRCRRYLRQEFLGNGQIDAKVGQVAVVDPDDRRPGIERDAQFGRVMDLDQRVQSGLGGMAEIVRQRLAERGDDQQHRIGPGGTGFDNLVRIDDEILAQHRRGLRVPHDIQILQRTAEMIRLGENGDRRGARIGVAPGRSRRRPLRRPACRQTATGA